MTHVVPFQPAANWQAGSPGGQQAVQEASRQGKETSRHVRRPAGSPGEAALVSGYGACYCQHTWAAW